MPRLLGVLLLLSALTGSLLLAQEPKKEPELTQEERAKLMAEARRLNESGGRLYQAGKFQEAEQTWRQELALYQRLYPRTQFPEGHPTLAQNLNNLGILLQQQGQLGQAKHFHRQALEAYQRLYPPTRFPEGHPDIASSLNNLGILEQETGRFARAETLLQQALEMNQRLYPAIRYPDGHRFLATSLNNMGLLLRAQGQLDRAEAYFRQALAMRQRVFPVKLYPDHHLDLANSLNNLGGVLVDQGRFAQGEPFCRQSLAMYQKLYPKTRFPAGHPRLARNLANQGALFQSQGQLTLAEAHYRQSLAMYQQFYPLDQFPDGHPDLADSLSKLARVLQDQNRYAQAEPLYRQALDMQQKLYPAARSPDGHPDLLRTLGYVALLLESQGQNAQAEGRYRQALAMAQQLYPRDRFPDGHAQLAGSRSDLGMFLQTQGQLAQAEPLLHQALTINEQLYPPTRFPDGHPDLAASLDHLAGLFQAQGQYAQAEPLYCQALTMYRRLAITQAELRGEGEMLTLLAYQPQTRQSYLSLMQHAPTLSDRGYDMLWADRGYLTRMAEQKHLAVRTASVSPAFRQQWEELVSLKRQRAQLLLAPETPDPETLTARERQREAWDRQIHDLSAQVRDGLPALQELQRQDNSTPVDLQKSLPQKSIFVDLLRYTLFEQDPAKPGKAGEKQSLRYVAFLVTKDQIHHVDLGPAEPLEAAVKQWRESITRKNLTPDLKSPATLRRQLWEPLEKQFPPGTTTVYLCPDQMLCFLPWGALPGKKAETVLLEDYCLAIVPHGPYLLGQLLGTKEKETKKTDLLVLGGVKYNDAPVQATVAAAERGPDDPKAAPVQAVQGSWPYLKGTATEAETIEKLAQQQKLQTHYLTAQEAGTERFKQELPKARIAHLATHGFFADPKFRSVFQLDEKHFAMRGNERVGAGALLPSLLSGLVFAGANRPETPGRGIVTAEELFDLDLTSMELAVLSACETGLGDVGGGEGVFGLQRAFHVVGCQNVIASLWKVNDVATMVLMEEFYRNLWEKKLSKREALRQAQLTVYRNPDLVTRRAKEMGVRGIEDEAQQLPAAGPAPAKRSPPAWWAAFLLSGLGE